MSSKSKRKQPKGLASMSREERVALADWAKRFRSVLPEIQRMGLTAKEIHKQMIEAPQWQIAEGTPVLDGEKPSLPSDPWNTGGPTVNYVDHIEPINPERNKP